MRYKKVMYFIRKVNGMVKVNTLYHFLLLMIEIPENLGKGARENENISPMCHSLLHNFPN